jgi:hypothetical protein
VLAALKELHVREEDIIDLRLKDGRAISTDRRNRLKAQRDLLAELLAGHDALLSETEPKPKDDGIDLPVVDEGKSISGLSAQAKLREDMARRGYALPV